MGTYTNLIGRKFGRLSAISQADYKIENKIVYVCECDCGNTAFVKACNLTRTTKPTRSCGCIRKELNKTRGIKYNLSKDRLYHIWASMRARCNNKNDTNYQYYGGRGITVCESWDKDAKAFFDWAYSNGYDKDAKRGACTLDRIDVNGNYEPDNCRWVDMKTQVNNRRNKKT